MQFIEFVGSGDAFNRGGKNSQCMFIKFKNHSLFVDFGPQTLQVLRKNEFNFNSFDAILITHFHGDHIGGIPYLLLNYKHLIKREKPLTIIGGKGIQEKIKKVFELLFGKSNFENIPLKYIELDIAKNTINLGDITIQTFPMKHKPESLGYKITDSKTNKTISITGDTGPNKSLKDLRSDADILICECGSMKPVNELHLSYEDIYDYFGKDDKIILNHTNEEISKNKEDIYYYISNDGDIIEF